MKYQTLNSKSDNLSFQVLFLFFANFSRLTAVKERGVYRKMLLDKEFHDESDCCGCGTYFVTGLCHYN